MVEDAAHHDSKRASVCTGQLVQGDILVADRAYLDFSFLNGLASRDIFFVVRKKTNTQFKVVESLKPSRAPDPKKQSTQILADEKVQPAGSKTSTVYTASGGMLRMVKAFVKVRGEMREMVFLTNNFSWSGRTIAELYRARWGIETFFKEIKQTCQIHDFIGYSENAVKWQVWAGLVGHLLLRYIRHLAKWKHSFSRLAGVVRGSLWLKKKLLSLLELYGTAGAVILRMPRTKSLYFQPLLNFANAPNGTEGS